MIKNLAYDEFQHTVSELLICNRSILDILAKTQESNAHMNRAVIKTVTGCGCMKIDACKKDIPPEASISDLRELLESHLAGQLCDNCRDTVESSIGKTLFYLAALCNILDLNLYDIMLKEQKRLKILGVYNMA